MTTAHPDNSRPDVREDLLDAAMEIVVEQRDLSFSLRQLADAARTSTMSIYTHFGNREGLHRALSARAFDLFAETLQQERQLAQKHNPQNLLRHMAIAYRTFALAHPSAFDLLFGDIGSFETVPPLSNEYEGLPSPSENGYVVYGMYASAIDEGVRLGIFDDSTPSRLLMDTFWAQLHGLVALERLGYVRSPADADERFAYGIEAILKGLRQAISSDTPAI